MSASNDDILDAVSELRTAVESLAVLVVRSGDRLDRIEDALVAASRESRERDEYVRRHLDTLTDAIVDLRRDFERHTHR